MRLPKHRLSQSCAPLRSLLLPLAAIAALWGPAPASAQDPAAIFARTKQRFEQAVKRSKLPGKTQLRRLIESLAPLRSSDAKLRESGCSLVARMMKLSGRNADTVGIRLSGIGIIASLAEDGPWADRLMKEVLAPGTASLRRLSFRAERLLGALRSPAHVEALLRAVEKGKRHRQLLALGALAHLSNERAAPLLDSRADLLVPLSRSKDLDVRSRAILVLGRMRAQRTLAPLFAATSDEHPSVRRATCISLGRRLGEEACDLFLGRLLDDPSARVREEAAVALAGAKDDTCVPLLIRRLGSEPLRVRSAIAETLRRLTGQSLPPDSEAWREWQQRAKAGGRAPQKDRYGRDVSEVPSYYGLPLRSDRILFILDVSGSMGYSVGHDSKVPKRIDRAKAELSKVLESLDERTRFSILFFSQGLAPMGSSLVAATPKNISRALRFIEAQPARGGTDTFGALKLAFHGYKELDTIFLLSDGIPSVGSRTHPYGILEKVVDWNREKGIRIHSIALLNGEMLNPFRRRREDKAAAEHFMQLLAEETGGRFVSVRGL